MNRDNILADARSMLQARFRHMGRSPSGFDCVGLIIWTMRQQGYNFGPLISTYSQNPIAGQLTAFLKQHFVPIDRPEHGCVISFTEGSDVKHCGFYDSRTKTLIHAVNATGRVVEQPYDRFWRMCTSQCYAPSGDL